MRFWQNRSTTLRQMPLWWWVGLALCAGLAVEYGLRAWGHVAPETAHRLGRMVCAIAAVGGWCVYVARR